MDFSHRITRALTQAVDDAAAHDCPPRLAAAVRQAVFAGGARVRPQLCLAVACACGDDDPALSDAAAASVELLHCASLVHDDLPAFDNAATRRGAPSVHTQHGVPLAILAGDALIALAFEFVARQSARSPGRLAGVVMAIGAGVGMAGGIAAGQAWESEPRVRLRDYQRAKTGALFVAATQAGALAAGADPRPWRTLGVCLGEAYQVADDIRDVMASPADLGKPCGQDALLGRPSAAAEFGLTAVVEHFHQLMGAAADAVPACAGGAKLRALVHAQTRRLLPQALCADLERVA